MSMHALTQSVHSKRSMEVSQTGFCETEGEDFHWSTSTMSMHALTQSVHSKRSMEVSQTGVWETGGEDFRWSASTKSMPASSVGGSSALAKHRQECLCHRFCIYDCVTPPFMAGYLNVHHLRLGDY